MNATDNYIIFELGGSTYAVRSADVLHIDMIEHVTPVPHAADAVEGIVFSRGQVIPAVDLRTRFGLPRQPPTPQSRLIFLHVQKRTVALIVDSAREFRSLPGDSVRPIDETLHGIRGNYLQGVVTIGDRLVLILDLPAVLDLENFAFATPQPVRTS